MSTRAQNFKDIDLTFRLHPKTNELSTLKNERAINNSISNILKLIKGDLPFNEDAVPNIRGLLFEPVESAIAATMEKRIHMAITQLEPRVKIVFLETLPDLNRNRYHILLHYKIRNNTEVIEFRDVLERVA